MSHIGERIKEIRKVVGFTQARFARIFGIDGAHISKIESGKANPSKQLIISICRSFSIREDWILEGKGPMEESPLSDAEKKKIKALGEEKEIEFAIMKLGFCSSLLQDMFPLMISMLETTNSLIASTKVNPHSLEAMSWKGQRLSYYDTLKRIQEVITPLQKAIEIELINNADMKTKFIQYRKEIKKISEGKKK